MGNRNVKNSQKIWPGIISGLAFLVVLYFSTMSCSKKEKWKELEPGQNAAATLQQTASAKELCSKLAAVQDSIRKYPAQIRFRQQLLSAGIDNNRNLVRAAGIGKPPANASSPAIARQAAEQAAYIDACRWLLYMRKWHQNINFPDFGSIKGQLPGARIIYKEIDENGRAIALVETDLH